MPKKVILISGGSAGLGKAIAEKLAPNNIVVILSHNIDKLRTISRELNCDFVEAELTDYETLKTAVNTIINKHHTIDVLVNNAGIWMEGQLDDNDPQKVKELVNVNVTGTILLSRAVIPGMRFRKSGQIINIVSQDGLSANENRSVYSASKWAITGFTKCLQADLSKENINVTGVYPGLVNTSLYDDSGVQKDIADAMDPSEVASLVEYVINLNPNTVVPEVSIINKTVKSKNMDDTNAPAIDLNIDPNMIAARDDSPQMAPSVPQPTAPATPPAPKPGVIDISPGSTDAFPSTPPVSTHIDNVPLSEPPVQDITPKAQEEDLPSHLTDLTPPEPVVEPSPEPQQTETTQTLTPPQVPPSASATPGTLPDGNIVQAPTPVIQTAPITLSSPLAEDPDLVKLVK